MLRPAVVVVRLASRCSPSLLRRAGRDVLPGRHVLRPRDGLAAHSGDSDQRRAGVVPRRPAFRLVSVVIVAMACVIAAAMAFIVFGDWGDLP